LYLSHFAARIRNLNMISIIISSSNPEYLSAVKKNIQETIGVPYEVLAVDNAEGKKGICEVYNTAGAKAKYDVLCFMHEDIVLMTTNWGHKVVEIMSDPEIGLLGVAGSKYKSLFPCGWSCPGIHISRHKVNIIQRFKFEERETTHFVYNSDNEALVQVATIDGVWMCTRKDVFAQFRFDDQLLKRFHGYDLEYSLQVGRRYKVCVTFDLLIDHFSEGNYSREWLEAILLLHKKHHRSLPLIIGTLPASEQLVAEKAAGKFFLKQMKAFNYSLKDKIAMLRQNEVYRVLGQKLYWLFHIKILFKRY
jgi:hypothetical protein